MMLLHNGVEMYLLQRHVFTVQIDVYMTISSYYLHLKFCTWSCKKKWEWTLWIVNMSVWGLCTNAYIFNVHLVSTAISTSSFLWFFNCLPFGVPGCIIGQAYHWGYIQWPRTARSWPANQVPGGETLILMTIQTALVCWVSSFVCGYINCSILWPGCYVLGLLACFWGLEVPPAVFTFVIMEGYCDIIICTGCDYCPYAYIDSIHSVRAFDACQGCPGKAQECGRAIGNRTRKTTIRHILLVKSNIY